MIPLQFNVSLKPYNTLAVDVEAKIFCAVSTVDELQQVLQSHRNESLLILGGGSNLVLTSNFDGLVVHNRICGVDVLEETEASVLLQVGAGENWDDLVVACVGRGWFGLENLSWIPGSVGAAPIQNIGAYGVELKDVLVQVETVQLSDLSRHVFTREQCRFDYRDSVFKREQKGRQVIVAVRLRLSKAPRLKLDYGEIRKNAEHWGYDCTNMTPVDVREIIIRTRSEKLPDPAHLPNVGSFFKNPVVSRAQFEKIRSTDPDVVAYQQEDGVKLAAGWLVDQMGFKGKRLGQAKVHDRQALVLVNEGSDSKDVMVLAHQIQKSVRDRWGVELEIEPSIV
ncbi:MAG: UDP-N-acetylenolpyruvoylglucosamine reductase [Pseudomonadales bacterium]|nr:UDP-N-acetylenolpyruvoylglucosamine reductase [Pseudomonadales bacterium]